MPHWIYNRPPVKCNDTEVRLARMLNDQLPGDWIVRWGYWYEDDSGTVREGDFLIWGPAGILLLEAKTSIHHQVHTGEWSGSGPGGDNPVMQLLAQHAGVVRRLKEAAKGRHVPWVAKALALPTLDIDPAISEYRSVPRGLIAAGNDLRQFQATWRRLFNKPSAGHAEEHRQVFLDAFGEGMNPRQVKAFVSETDRLILRQTTADYRLLDMLSENRQLIVEGGVGTGKSWYAIEQARRYAENESASSGRQVLLLGYNLALCERLRLNVAKLKLKRGCITVRSSEQLAAEILAASGITHEPPAAKEAVQEYFDDVLPQLALAGLQSAAGGAASLRGRYEALVVDEAQDHDTALGGDAGPAGGWWGLYALLLKDGWDSPVAIFGDPAQRPPFRPADRFDWRVLRAHMTQHAHLRLTHSLRYTRQMLQFLRGLEAEGTAPLVQGLKCDQRLLDGPEVLQVASNPEHMCDTVAEVLEGWQAAGLCAPSRALILYERSGIQHSVLAGVSRLCAHELRPYLEATDDGRDGELRHCSIHKAKGLDALGVVLVGMKPFGQLTRPQDRYTYFMGASRSRQLLACVHLA